MISREEIFNSKEKIWVLCIGKDSLKNRLSPAVDLVDWYNNQLLTKSLVAEKIETDFGKLTLLGTSGILPVKKLLVFGLGDAESLTVPQARKFVQELDQILVNLEEKSPWIILPKEAPAKFGEEIEKSRTSTESLAHAKIT